jgi:Protein of unknown function (DUF4230)
MSARSRAREHGSRRVTAVLAAGTAAVAFVATAAFAVVVGLHGLGQFDPFARTTTERPDSVSLDQVRDLASFDAATGRFQTLVDQQQSTKLLPGWVSGSDVVLAAAGDVDATVDFSHLDSAALQRSADGHQVTVHLPAPELSTPKLDPTQTRVLDRQRGLLDRVGDAVGDGDPVAQDQLEQRASTKLAAAATQSDLTARAKANTSAFLQHLLVGGPVTQVTVVWAPAPAQP